MDAKPACLANRFIRLALLMSTTAAGLSLLRNQAPEIHRERMALDSEIIMRKHRLIIVVTTEIEINSYENVTLSPFSVG